MNYDKYFWTVISCACILYGVLLFPNYDDGNAYFFNFFNTIGLRNTFYNDIYGQYFHFMKPTTLLYAFLHSWADGPSFRILALVQSFQVLLSLRLVYLCTRRYATKEAAQAGTCIFFYLLVAQWGFEPTRAEPTVVLCCLATFWLCERFQETRSLAYVVGASATAFLVSIPMHPCGAIPCIYLLLFTLASRHLFSREAVLVLGALSCVFALAGAALLIYPGITSFTNSLALFSFDGDRFIGLRGEYLRVWKFVRTPVYSPMIIFIAAVFLSSLACAYRHIRLHSLKQHRNIVLFLGAVVIGLGVLPSAQWEIYMVYYYLPLILGFAVAFDSYERRGGRFVLLRCALAFSGALVFWCSYGVMPLLYAALCSGGYFLAAAFAQRMPAARLTVLIVAPMLLYQAVYMVATDIIFDRADKKIKETREVVLAGAWFAFSGANVISVNAHWCGAKTQIIPAPGGAIIKFHPVAEEKAALIGNHRLVRLFGQASYPQQKPEWNARRTIGSTFYGLSNDFSDTTAFLERQGKPLGFATVKTTPLSNEVLDTYACPLVRGLKFVQYSFPQPAP